MADNIFIAYFSGTGGTAFAAKSLAAALEAQGASVSLKEIKKGNEPRNGSEDYFVLLFPIHAFNAPLPVYRWLEALENVNGINAAVIAISGGGEVSPNTACRLSSIRRLRKKGYNVIYEDAIVMPSNVLVYTPAGMDSRLLKALPIKTDMIARDILAGREKKLKAKLFDRMCSRFGEMEKTGAKLFGRGYYTTDACTGCGKCAKDCPAGNILMESGRPVYGKECCMCLRCVYECPVGAIKVKVFKSAVLKKGFDISEIENRPVDFTQPLPKSAAWKGLRIYLEEVEKNI